MNQGLLHGVQREPFQLGVAFLDVKTQLAFWVIKHTQCECVFVIDEAFGGCTHYKEM